MNTMITVTERGHSELSPAQWITLQTSESFWRLIEGKVMTVTALPNGRARINGSGFVGRALCNDILVEVREKVEGALFALLSAVTDTFRTSPAPAPATNLGATIALIVRGFVNEVHRYVSEGREWRYETRRAVSSLVGGRLNLALTLTLRARGMHHLAAFDRQVISHAVEKNRLIYAALREVEVLARLVRLDDTDLMAARKMSLFFEDCRDAETVFGASETLALQVQNLRLEQHYSKHERMLALAEVLLAHNSFEHGDLASGIIPFSWFANLEHLFEQAVRHRLNAVVSTYVDIRKGRSQRRAVFPVAGVLVADPDLVVRFASTTVVGDVKYKEWSGTAEPSDLYQLLAHAASFGADRAFLVYPSERFNFVDLGDSATGIRTWLFSIGMRDLDNGLRTACNILGISTW